MRANSKMHCTNIIRKHPGVYSVTILAVLSVIISNMEVLGSLLSPREEEAIKFLNDLEAEYSQKCTQMNNIAWNYYTNMTDATEQANVAAQDAYLGYSQQVQAKIIKAFPDWESFNDTRLKREIKYIRISGPGQGSEKDVAAMNKIGAQMESGYAKATVCEYKNPAKCDLHLDPDMTHKLETATDPDELAYYWNAWHDSTSKLITSATYSQYIYHLNRIANNNGFPSLTGFWMSSYDAETPGWTAQSFIKDMSNIWEQIRPKYNILYAYVRMKLQANAPFGKLIKKCGKIPIHLTGNMWGQTWAKLDKYTKPFPNAPSLDVTNFMQQQGWTARKMFQVSDEFFQGLGLKKMTQSFWEKSMLERPPGRDVACHATAHDMCNGKNSVDFRIKMCTTVTMKDLVVVHHEMGHIEYYMQATHLPITFRTGANPGFHEAIGDTLALAVTTPVHLQCVLKFPLGLDLNCNAASGPSDKPVVVTESDMNHLFKNAMEKMPMVAFAMAVDTWRFDVFDGKIKPEDYNKKWWEIRMRYQDLELPNPRGDDKFDPSAKYHIPSNTEYIRYFFSNIVQFSFYEGMCKQAGEFDPKNPNSKPLYQCDFSGNTKAGMLLESVLKMGFENPWPIPLQKITGKPILTADSFLNYFEPLLKKLEEELKANGEWDCLPKA